MLTRIDFDNLNYYPELELLRQQRLNRHRVSKVGTSDSKTIEPVGLDWDEEPVGQLVFPEQWLKESSMWDENANLTKPWPMRPCIHEIRETEFAWSRDQGGWAQPDSLPGPWASCPHTGKGMSYVPGPVYGREEREFVGIAGAMSRPYAYFTPSEVEWFQHTYNMLLPTIAPELDVGTFLAELIEIKGMIKQVVHAWKKRLMVWIRYVRKIGLTQAIAGAHINYIFGWKPFLSDLLDVVNAIMTLYERVDAALQGADEVHRKSRRSFIAPTTGEIENNFAGKSAIDCSACPMSPGSSNTRFNARTTTLYGTTELGLTVVYRYTMPDMDSLLTQIGALIEGVGFGKPLTVLWNVLPFSWLVSWFVDLESLVEAFDFSDPFVIETQILDIAISVKEKNETFVYREHCNANSVHELTDSHETYHRYSGEAVLHFIQPSIENAFRDLFINYDFSLSGQQIATLTSLGILLKGKGLSKQLRKAIRSL